MKNSFVKEIHAYVHTRKQASCTHAFLGHVGPKYTHVCVLNTYMYVDLHVHAEILYLLYST